MRLLRLKFLLVILYANSVVSQGSCPDGFVGAKCSVCQNDEACQTETGSDNATCSNRFQYSNNSVKKSYVCELKSQPNPIVDLPSLLKPGSLYVACSTGFANTNVIVGGSSPSPGIEQSPSPSPDSGSGQGTGELPAVEIPTSLPEEIPALIGRRLRQQPVESPAFCDVSFVVDSSQVEVACLATDCAIKLDTLDPIICSKTKCSCRGDDTCGNQGLISAIVASVAGQAVLNCTESGDCSLKLEGLPIDELAMSCTAGECLVPIADGGDGFNGTDTTTTPDTVTDINPFIASIPTIVLTLFVAGVGMYAWYHPSLQRTSKKVAGAPDAWATKDMPSEGTHVQALEFSNISVHVPMTPDAIARRRYAIRSKALAHFQSDPTASDEGIKDGHGVTSLVKATKEKLGLRTSEEAEYSPVLVSAAAYGGAVETIESATEAADYVTSLHSGNAADSWYIVNQCSGKFKGGELVGVLGPSGCGKTTLLGSLVGGTMDVDATAIVSGRVQVDGNRRREDEVAYVPQSDLFIPTLTVDECLWYSALLRLPRGTSSDEIRARVDRTLTEVGLRHVADVKVGGSGGVRGVSGGERRRVTIAMELVTDPHILVLDEPSSGLDSYTAIKLMGTLKAVAARGRIVVASLHQPSREMFMMLDQAVLMGHGRMLYMGPPGQAESWFADHGAPCPPGTAIAEHILEIANSASGIRQVLEAESIAQKTKELAYTTSRTNSGMDLEGGGKGFAGSEFSMRPNSPLKKQRTMQDYMLQLGVMFWRSFVDIIRNPTLLALHVAVSTIVGLVAGCIFYDLPLTSIGVQNRMGATFFALAFLAFTSLTTVDLLMNERAVVAREVRSGYYSPAAYLLSKVALDGLLLRLLPAVLYWLPFYYMAGFKTGATYAATYCFTLMLFNLAVGALSMAVTVASSTAGQSSFIMNFILLFSLVFTGFLVNVESIPEWIRWLHYFSTFYYAFEAMLTSELSNMKLTFIYTPPNSEPINIPNIDGVTFLQTLGFNVDNTTLDICVLIIFYVGFVLLALLLFVLSQSSRYQRFKAKVNEIVGQQLTKLCRCG